MTIIRSVIRHRFVLACWDSIHLWLPLLYVIHRNSHKWMYNSSRCGPGRVVDYPLGLRSQGPEFKSPSGRVCAFSRPVSHSNHWQYNQCHCLYLSSKLHQSDLGHRCARPDCVNNHIANSSSQRERVLSYLVSLSVGGTITSDYIQHHTRLIWSVCWRIPLQVRITKITLLTTAMSPDKHGSLTTPCSYTPKRAE
jgi:hypothetical protein